MQVIDCISGTVVRSDDPPRVVRSSPTCSRLIRLSCGLSRRKRSLNIGKRAPISVPPFSSRIAATEAACSSVIALRIASPVRRSSTSAA